MSLTDIIEELDRLLNEASVKARQEGLGSKAQHLAYAYQGALACLKPLVEKAKG